MERVLEPKLQQLYAENKAVYSISRLDCINRCLFEAYLTYIKKQENEPNCYSSLGSRVHDVLEGIVNGENTEADLLPSVMSELEDMDLLGIEFPKDRKGENSLREGWIKDMTHFCKTYHSPRGKNLKTEELFIYTSPAGHKLIGYIDLQRVRKNGSIDIYDYKTSSEYKGNAIKEHGRQLIVYAIGLEQAGYKVNSVSWIMLKYVEIIYMGYKTAKSKNKTEIHKIIERKKIPQEMCPIIEREMLELGYDNIDIQSYLELFAEENDFNVLPENVRNLYTMKPYVHTYELTDEARHECEEYIDSTISKWEQLDSANEKNYPPKSFTQIQKNGKEVPDIFFCTSLCGHFKQCYHIQEYLEQLNIQQSDSEEDSLFL